jgi:hypothetical protein
LISSKNCAIWKTSNATNCVGTVRSIYFESFEISSSSRERGVNRTDGKKETGEFTRKFKNQTPLCCVGINTTLFCARKREREKERDALVSISLARFFLLFLVVKKKTKKTKREIL